jgi:spore coat protein CotH
MHFIQLYLMRPGFLLLIFLLQSLNGAIFSQLPGGNLFDKSVVHEIRIEFDEDNFWDILLENYNSHMNKSALPVPRPPSKTLTMQEKLKLIESLVEEDDIPFLEGKVDIDGTLIDQAGIRLKGYSSFFNDAGIKKSLKIDFNEYNDTISYFGIKKVNLNNGVGDPSFQRDVICYELLRKAGIAVPRTAYAKVFLNDVYWGLYIIVEQIDKTFLKNHFADGNGNLYKAIGWTTLEYISDQFEDYSESIELKTNEDTADGSDYVNLVKMINSLSGAQFNDSIQKLFYVDYFLKILAIDIITKNWDSFMQNGRNFYLYHEPVSDLFYWIPWDYNLALDGQLSWSSGDGEGCVAEFDFEYDTSGTAINYTISASADEFSYLWMDFGDLSSVVYDRSNVVITDTTTILYITGSHAYEKKGIYPIYFSRSDMNNCWYEYDEKVILMDTTGLCHSVFLMDEAYLDGDTTYNKVFAADSSCCECNWDRNCAALKQKLEAQSHIDDFSYPIEYNLERPLINKIMANTNFKERYLDIFSYIIDSVYQEDEIIEMINSNTDLIRDAVYADTNLIFSVDDFENDIQILCDKNYSVTNIIRQLVKRKNGLLEEYNSLGYSAKPIEQLVNYNDLVINEFAAALRDDEGESTDDWIELYNNTGTIVPLNHFWLSDSIPGPEKFNFPGNGAIKPKGFVTVWADKKNSNKGLHANFKLSGDGEEIILYNDLWSTIDSLVFDAQMSEYTFGRYPDGIGTYINMIPTWNRPNGTMVNIEQADHQIPNELLNAFKIYPNPASTLITILTTNSAGTFKLTLFNSQGQVLLNKVSSEPLITLNVSDLARGLYILQIETRDTTYKKKVVLD